MKKIELTILTGLILFSACTNSNEEDITTVYSSELVITEVEINNSEEQNEEEYIIIKNQKIHIKDEILYLDSCDIQNEDLVLISKLKNLKNLDLSNNNISDISILFELSNLKMVNLSNNKITDWTAVENVDIVLSRGNPSVPEEFTLADKAIDTMEHYYNYQECMNFNIDSMREIDGVEYFYIQVFMIVGTLEENNTQTSTQGWYHVNKKTSEIYEKDILNDIMKNSDSFTIQEFSQSESPYIYTTLGNIDHNQLMKCINFILEYFNGAECLGRPITDIVSYDLDYDNKDELLILSSFFRNQIFVFKNIDNNFVNINVFGFGKIDYIDKLDLYTYKNDEIKYPFFSFHYTGGVMDCDVISAIIHNGENYEIEHKLSWGTITYDHENINEMYKFYRMGWDRYDILNQSDNDLTEELFYEIYNMYSLVMNQESS